MKHFVTFAILGLMLIASPAWAQEVHTLYEINTDQVIEGTFVRVEDVIVTGVSYNGCYVQEQAGGEYSGAWLYTGGAPGTVIGDLVDIEAIYEEYYGMTELNASSTGGWVVVDTGYFPSPYVARAAEVNTAHPLEAEKWECVLVQVLNVELTIPPDEYGGWFAMEFGYPDNDQIMADDQLGVPGPTEIGPQISSITGPLQFSFDDFKIQPRDDDDIVYIGAAPAPNLDYAIVTGASTIDVRFDRDVDEGTAETAGNYFLDVGTVLTAELDAVEFDLVHLTLQDPMTVEVLLTLTVFDVQNTDGIPMSPQDVPFWGGINDVPFVQFPDANGDSSAIMNEYVTLTGVVHSKYDIWGNHVYLQDINPPLPDRVPFNGIEIYMSSLLDEIQVGDIVVIGDMLTEYYGMTSMTEPFLHYEIVSSGNTVLGPEEITIGDPTDAAHYEQYEGALVEVKEVVVVERPGEWNFYDWAVSVDWLNWLRVGSMGDYDYNPGLGDTLNVRGTLRYEYGEYKLMPRSDDDIDIIWQNPISVPGMPAEGNFLAQNYPNPFNPATKIAFRLASEGEAVLSVFDVQGRLVKTLHTGVLPAGEQQVIWHGDTEQGSEAPSGLYLYRLQTAEETLTRSMLLLK